MQPSDAIWQAIVESNRAWLDGRPLEVAGLFDERAVMLLPTGDRLVGRAAIVQSYVDYVTQVKTLAFEELDHEIDLFDATAVVTYTFRVRYELAGEVHDETARETLVFAQQADRWRAIWRTQHTSAAPN